MGISIGKKDVRDFLMMIFGSFLLAFTFNVFYVPNNLVISGVSGLSIIVNYISHIEPSLFIAVVNVLLLVLSVAALGLESSVKTIIGTLFYTLFVYLTKDINVILDIHFDEMIMTSLVGGVLTGLGAGIVFKYEYSTGGTDVLTLVAAKYSKQELAKCQLVINTIIVSFGGLVFGLTMIIYAILVNYIESILMDKVLLGIVGSKVFYIGTEKTNEVKKFIMEDMKTGVTLLEAKGGHLGKTKYIIMTTVPSNKYVEVKKRVKEIDSEAFILVSDVYDVLGGKR